MHHWEGLLLGQSASGFHLVSGTCPSSNPLEACFSARAAEPFLLPRSLFRVDLVILCWPSLMSGFPTQGRLVFSLVHTEAVSAHTRTRTKVLVFETSTPSCTHAFRVFLDIVLSLRLQPRVRPLFLLLFAPLPSVLSPTLGKPES